MAFPFDQGPAPLPPDFLRLLRQALLAQQGGRTDTGPMINLPVMGPGGATGFDPFSGWVPGPTALPTPVFPSNPFEPRTSYPVGGPQRIPPIDMGAAGPRTSYPAPQPLPPDYGSRAPFAPTPVQPHERFPRAIGQGRVPSNPGVGWQFRHVLGAGPKQIPDYTNPNTPFSIRPPVWATPNRGYAQGTSFRPPYRVGGRY